MVVGAPAHVRSCLCVCAAATYCRGCLRAALSNWPQPTRASRGAGDEVRACVLACACLRERGCVGAWEHPNLCVRACATGGSLSRVCVCRRLLAAALMNGRPHHKGRPVHPRKSLSAVLASSRIHPRKLGARVTTKLGGMRLAGSNMRWPPFILTPPVRVRLAPLVANRSLAHGLSVTS